MARLSALFHQKFDALVAADPTVTQRADYQAALLYNLLVQTSCFRYWGQGTWTEYAQELYRRGLELVTVDVSTPPMRNSGIGFQDNPAIM